MRKIAEGEIIVHTQKSGQNVDSLRQYLASLRAESQKTSVGIDQLAKSMVMANIRGASLGKVIKGLASAAGFGGFGAAAYLAIDKFTRGITDAQQESDKLTETLNKAVGSKAADSIEGTTQKMQALTSAINETRTAIGKQGMMNAIAAFFFNDDADKASKAFLKAVEDRISLGDKLTSQEAERIAQQKILMDLDENMAEVFKINIETRKRLSQIETNESLTAQQKLEQSRLAEEERSDKLRALRSKKERETAKKDAEAKKASDEDFAKTSIKISDSLIKQENELFQKNAEEFKKSQEEKAKAAEEASKRISDASKKAAQKIQEQDERAKNRFSEKTSLEQDILGSTAAGRNALANARKQRATEVSKTNFRDQETILRQEAKRLSKEENRTITLQDVRERMARGIAAGENPTLMQKMAGTSAGIEPGQIARSSAESQIAGQGKGIPDLIGAIERLISTYNSAPLITTGAGSK